MILFDLIWREIQIKFYECISLVTFIEGRSIVVNNNSNCLHGDGWETYMLYLKADYYRINTDNKEVTRVPKKAHLGDSKQHRGFVLKSYDIYAARVTCVLFLRHE